MSFSLSRTIHFVLYSHHVKPMADAFKIGRGRMPLGMTRTRWINAAIGEKLDRDGLPPADQVKICDPVEESVERQPNNVLAAIVYIAPKLVVPLRCAVQEMGGSRNRWINDAIRMRLGLPLEVPNEPEPAGGVRMSLAVYQRNDVRIDAAIRDAKTTRTRWINDAIREKYTRDLAAGPAIVAAAAPRPLTPAQMEAAERKAKIEAIRARRLAEAAKEAEEIDFWG